MKIKLLKKIRKRFNWYLNSEGSPVLVDHKLKEVFLIDLDFYKRYFGYNSLQEVKDSISVSENEVCWRLCLTLILKPFGYNVGNRWYNIAKRKAQRHKNYMK